MRYGHLVGLRWLRWLSVGSTVAVALSAAPGFDTGLSPADAGGILPGDIPSGAWLRLRGMGTPSAVEAPAVAGVQRLADCQLRPLPFLRWGGDSWESPRRGGKAGHLPTDLREAFDRGRDYARAYGPAMAAWEIDNEPDVGWAPENPETFAAFHKAVFLGLQAGARERGLPKAAPVLSSPLGLPPGPFFERLHANGYLGYVGAFNYHYYGYAEDFTGVYRAWEAAVTGREGPEGGERREDSGRKAVDGRHGVPVEVGSLSVSGGTEGANRSQLPEVGSKLRRRAESSSLVSIGASSEQSKIEKPKSKIPGSLTVEDRENPQSEIPNPQSPPDGRTRHLPVFLTEYGYGLLSPTARFTAEGRIRQWRWFKTVGDQIRDLRIEGPMAFYLPPYLEYNLNEFGLTVPDDSGWARVWGAARERIPGRPSVGSPAPLREGPVFVSGHLWFTPADFGATKPEPWMHVIGQRVGRHEATPALAWLLDQAKRPYDSRPWDVTTPEPSPVVIDLVAGPDAQALKSWGGYVLRGRLEARGEGLEEGGQKTVGGGRWAVDDALKTEGGGRLAVGGSEVEQSKTPGNLAQRDRNNPQSEIPNPQSKDGGRLAVGGQVVDGGRKPVDGARKAVDGSEAEQSKIENRKSIGRLEARGVGLEDSGRKAVDGDRSAAGGAESGSGSGHELKAKSSALKAAAAANAERVGSLQLSTSTSTGKRDAAVSLASAELRLYNFGEKPISGRLVVDAEAGAEMGLAEGERLEAAGRLEARGVGREDRTLKTEGGARLAVDGAHSQQSKIPGLLAQEDRNNPQSEIPNPQSEGGARLAVDGAHSQQSKIPGLLAKEDRNNPQSEIPNPQSEGGGRLAVDGADAEQSKLENPESKILSLAPGELRTVTVVLRAAADRYVARTVSVRFVPDDGGPVSVFSTRVIPDASGMTPTVLHRFDHPADAAKDARALLLARPLASEEPRLTRQGQSRWLVSKGTRIEDWGKVWRMVVTALPDEPVRPAMVELPLPSNFQWPMTALMRLSYRMTVGVDRQPYKAAAVDVMFRTRNGNLYTVMPRIWAAADWQHYAEPRENFGLMFYGRAELPWRFADNEPVALVLFMRPRALPATFEFANAEITSFAR